MLSLVPLLGTRESVLILFLLVIFGGFSMSERRNNYSTTSVP